jgi:predicted transposase/invertase (TIGR01784 family)
MNKDTGKVFYEPNEKIPLYLNKGIFQKLFKIAEVSKLTEEQRKAYESNLKAKRDYMATIEFAKKEEGKKARELGREEGMELGLEKGMELGQLKSSFAIALKLKETGMSVDQISKITALSIEEIEQL